MEQFNFWSELEILYKNHSHRNVYTIYREKHGTDQTWFFSYTKNH